MNEPLLLGAIRRRLELDFDGELLKPGKWIDVEKEPVGGAVELDRLPPFRVYDPRCADDGDGVASDLAQIVETPDNLLPAGVQGESKRDQTEESFANHGWIYFCAPAFIAGTSSLAGLTAGSNAVLVWLDERHGNGIVDPKPEIYLETAWY